VFRGIDKTTGTINVFCSPAQLQQQQQQQQKNLAKKDGGDDDDDDDLGRRHKRASVSAA